MRALAAEVSIASDIPTPIVSITHLARKPGREGLQNHQALACGQLHRNRKLTLGGSVGSPAATISHIAEYVF
jgi:hypothetical protein